VAAPCWSLCRSMHFAGPAEHLQPLFHPYEIYARGTGYEMQFREKFANFCFLGMDGLALSAMSLTRKNHAL